MRPVWVMVVDVNNFEWYAVRCEKCRPGVDALGILQGMRQLQHCWSYSPCSAHIIDNLSRVTGDNTVTRTRLIYTMTTTNVAWFHAKEELIQLPNYNFPTITADTLATKLVHSEPVQLVRLPQKVVVNQQLSRSGKDHSHPNDVHHPESG